MTDPDFSVGSQSKKPRYSDVILGSCWLCDKRFNRKEDVGHPDSDKLALLFECIRAANDNDKLISKLNSEESDILSGKIFIKYHQNCLSKYVLKRQEDGQGPSYVRPKRSSFNFKELCFVCTKPCDRRYKRDQRRGWALITDKEKSLFENLYAAAERKGDTDMIIRLSGIECKDMVAADCRYHHGNKLCLPRYLGCDSSKVESAEDVTSKPTSTEQTMSVDEDTPEACSTEDESLLSWSDIQDTSLKAQPQKQDMYRVVSLLRSDILGMKHKLRQYPDPSDLAIEECQNFVPPSLLQAALWLTDQNAFENALPFNDASPGAKLRAMTLSETIMSMSGNDITPQSLGTAVYLDHVFGSSELVDVLSGLGYCVTYDELRRYKTSAARHTLDSSKTIAVDNKATYVPTSLKKAGDGSGFIHEGTDNVDINVETKDVKGTFHALARFMFQDQPVTNMFEKAVIPRGKDKSLKITDGILTLVESEPYQLPPMRPVPPRSHEPVKKMNDLRLTNQATNGTKDTTWLLLRMEPRAVLPDINQSVTFNQKSVVVPLWKGYNSQIASPKPRHLQTKTHRAHLPIIDAPPSDKRTLYTSMAQCKRVTHGLGQETSMQTMDQQLYALAQEVKWHLNDEFASHILRLGSVHAMMSYLSAIGKIWGNAGLRDLLVDSGVYAAGTAELFLQGKEYNRAVTAFIYSYEAFSQVRLSEFLKWLQQNNREIPDELWGQLAATKDLLVLGSTPQSAIIELQNLVEEHVQPQMVIFIAEASNKSPTFQLWDSFIEAVHVFLLNLRGEREGDWSLHLHSMLSVLPYYAVTDKVNYSRWTPVYLMDMISFPDDASAAFKRGEFSVRETCGGFIGTPSDMGTEHKIKELKGPAGLKHIAKKQAAMIRYSLTRHITGDWATQIKDRARPIDDKDEVRFHKEQSKAAMARDDGNVRKMVDQIKTICGIHSSQDQIHQRCWSIYRQACMPLLLSSSLS